MRQRLIPALWVLTAMICSACARQAAPVPEKEEVLRLMKAVADHQIAHPTGHSSANRDFPMGWVPASFYTGVMALYESSGDEKYLQQALNWAESNAWQPGPRLRHADDHACGQIYLELSALVPEQADITAIRAVYDSLMADPLPGRVDWWWCDALYMSPPTLARLAAVTGEKKYLNYMHDMFWDTVHFLFDREAGLMYRDEQYFYSRTASGQKVFWARGNGWTMAGIVRILQYLPEKDKKRIWYENLLLSLSASIVPLQGDDGLWRASLLDAAEYPAPESSSTGFISYALAWGVNQGLLDRDLYSPVIFRAWQGLVSAVHEDGMLGWVQPIGKSPDAVTFDDTQAYGAGAFVLAASEILKMIGPMEQDRK